MNTPLRKPWRFEDSLTAREKAEALSLFRAGKLSGNVPRRVMVDFAPPTHLEKFKPAPSEPLVTPAQVAAGAAILVGAFFAGRWWARREKAKKPVGKIGIDVFAAS